MQYPKSLEHGRQLIESVVSQLHGSLTIKPGSVELKARTVASKTWERVTCLLRIPPWRLVQSPPWSAMSSMLGTGCF